MASNHEQLHNLAIFDIDSASIGVAVVSYKKGTAIPVRELLSLRVQLDTHLSFDDFFARTLRSLEELTQKVLHDTHAPIHDIYVSLSAPWMSSQKRIARYERKKPFEFNQKRAREIIEKELKDPLSKNLDYHHFDDLEIFERRTTDIYLNGYPSLNALSKKNKVTKVEIHSITSVMSHTTKEAFSHIFERAFSRVPQFISNTFVLYQAIQKFIPDENSTLILDVGGTNTQVLVVHDDHLSSIASFPVGREQLIHEFSERASVSFAKARSLISLFTQNALDPQYQEGLSKLMDQSYRIWMKSFFELCDVLSSKKLLPSTLCLIAPSDISAWLRYHIMSTDELSEHVHSAHSLQLVELPLYLKLKAEDEGLAHLSDSELIPVIDVVGSLLQEQAK